MTCPIPRVRLGRPAVLEDTEFILWNLAMLPNNPYDDENDASSKEKDSIGSSQPKILIVDDNGPVREAVSKLLFRAAGWKPCGEAETGGEAIEKARQLQPDVILLDITLPDFSGFEAALVIAKELPNSKILIVSQHDPAQMLSKAVAAGALGYVTKTNLARDLVPAIRTLLDSKA